MGHPDVKLELVFVTPEQIGHGCGRAVAGVIQARQPEASLERPE